MNIRLFYVLSFIVLCSCKVSFRPSTEPLGFNIEPSTKSFVLIDGGITNTPGLAVKKKREGVVKEVKNQYLILLNTSLQKQLNFTSISDTTLNIEQRNNLLKKDQATFASLLNKYPNAIILILKDCYAGFNQGTVNKVSSWDGKSTSKVAEYSVFFDTEWIILQGNTVNEKTVAASRFHSNRTIQSGLLARGPGFAANKKDILEMAEQNALNVAQLFKY